MKLDFHVYDFSHLRLDDEQIIFDKDELHDSLMVLDYLHGRCHVFALAAIRVLGPEASFNIIHDFEGNNGEPQLVHAYVKYKDTMFDARGMIDLEDLADYEAESSMNIDYFELSESEVLKDISCGNWGQPHDGELEKISSFIKNHMPLYLSDNYHKMKSFILKHAQEEKKDSLLESIAIDLEPIVTRQNDKSFSM